MHYLKKIFPLLLSGALIVSNNIVAFAHEDLGSNYKVQENESILEETVVEEAVKFEEASENLGGPNIGVTLPGLLRGYKVPTSAHSWSDGSYSISGNTSVDTHLYTNKYFTGFTNATLTLKAHSSYNGHNRGEVKVTIFRMGIPSDTNIYLTTISAGESKTITMSNYQSDKKYYIKFSGTFYVTGSMAKK